MDTVLLAVDSVYGLIFLVAAVLAALQTQRDLILARSLVLIGAIFMAVRWSVWALVSDASWSTRGIVGALIGAALFVLVPGAIHWLSDRTKQQGENQSSIPLETERLVSQAQFAKVAELEAFLGGKDENDLRQLFDLQTILQKNINTQIIRIGFIKAGKEKDFFYNNYTDNGSFIMWAKEGHYSVGPSGVHIDAGPKDVLYLVTTDKFQKSQKKLVEFMNSALIPQSIKQRVSEFNDAVNKNPELMMKILDDKMHEDENYFLHSMDMGTPYYGVIVTAFANQIIPLKPTADHVMSAIAQSWKISQ